MQETQKQLQERLIKVTRVAKVIKGGRQFRFRALMAVGDENGSVGLAMAKANEVATAIQKATQAARKNVVKVNIINGTVPHQIVGRFGGGKVLLKPAGPGTGVIAGGPARIVLELAGVENILTKCLGSTTAGNFAQATLEGLRECETWEDVKLLRAS